MLGYRHDREDWSFLRANATPFPDHVFAAGEIAEEYHPTLIKKNQKRTSSCVGHGLSTLMAALQLLITGQERNYSAWFAYLAAQKASNMLGTDDGATLAGAMAAASQLGVCSDELLPFPGYYSTAVTPQAEQQAREHTLTQFAELRGYDAAWRYISSRQGPILIGTPWYDGQAAIGVDGIENKSTAFRGGNRGYHCRCVIGWSKRRDDLGRRFLWCQNSHSTAWGNQGESEIAPELFDAWADDRFSAFFGASESRPFEPRPVEWSKQNWIVC